jgi:L-seryl-tRNA(Ser) seleniumtransferase
MSAVLEAAANLGVGDRYGMRATTDAARAVLETARAAVMEGGKANLDPEALAHDTRRLLETADRSSLRAVFNLTGTVLHTNLGRAILAETARAAALTAMSEAVALEFDLDSGRRGERDDHVRALLCELTGAEDATIVNNNAAAVLLTLNTFSAGREAIVSRGELIEIGGAFRMPDIMARAGCKMVEVGTTNRTHARDYRAAIGANTGVILKVHASNYRIEGFTAEVDAAELAEIARGANVPLVNDLGSGTLVDLARYGLRREPTVREAVAQGAGVVTFSGDKLLGGPQAGFIVGKHDLLRAINANPMKRALRVDKIRLAAIEATLKLYRNPDRLAERLPTLWALARPKGEIAAVARRLAVPLAAALAPAFIVEPCECLSEVGSGALPVDGIASAGLRLRPADGGGATLQRLAAGLRALSRPVIGRIVDGALVLDLRCLTDEAAFLAGFDDLSLS